MNQKKIKAYLFYGYGFILVLSIILFILNLDTISVIHAKASEWLPVQKYETYSMVEVSLLYLIIILVIINLLFIKINKLKAYKQYIFSLTPIILLIFLILFIVNPHSIILYPTGFPPTLFDSIELGGIFVISLFLIFIIISITYLYLEGNFLKYLRILLIIIGAILLSDFIHESGHAFFILISGGEITEYIPFPILLGGEFNAGYVGFTDVPSELVSLVLLGGEIFQWIIICIILILFYFKPKIRRNIFLFVFLAIALLDFPLYVLNNSINLPHWFIIGSTEGDIIKFSTLVNLPMWIFIILAFVQLFIGAVIIYLMIYKYQVIE